MPKLSSRLFNCPCKIIMYLFIFLILTFSFPQIIFANSILTSESNPSFEVLDRNSGLSNLSVSSIVQDRDGFLWFGTQGGLNHYNGKEMKVFRHDPFTNKGLIHNLIQTMYYDRQKHELWIGTYQGLSHLIINNKKFNNYTVKNDGLSNPVVVAITIDNARNVWIGTLEGLNKLNPETGEIKQYDIPGDVVRDLKVDSQGRLLIASYQGLLYYKEQKDSIESLDLNLPSPYVMAIKEFKPGIITLGLWEGGVVEVNLKTKEVKRKTFKDNRVYSLLETKDGIQWVGTWGGGLYALEPDGKIYHFSGTGSNSSLPHPIVYSMLQDDSDILWVGTNGGGIAKVNPRKRDYVKFAHDPKDKNSLSAGKINSILRDSKGDLWFAIYNAGLNRYDADQEEIIKYQHNPKDSNSLPTDSIVDMIELNKQQLLLATHKGLVYYDYKNNEFNKANILPDDRIVYSIAKGNNSDLLIGTYTHGLYHYNRETNRLTNRLKNYHHSHNANSSLSNNLVYDIVVDSKDRVWVATNDGLNLLEPGRDKFKVYRKVVGNYNQLASNNVRVVFEDSQSRIWIGMVGGGLALYNEEQKNFKSFSEKDGLSSNIITGILEDGAGRIWAATHNGISILDPATREVYVLTPDDGIGGREFNSGHFKDVDGTMLFGGVHGVAAIPASFTNLKSDSPQVYITNVDIFQTSIDPKRPFFNNQHLNFNYNDKFLGFKFVALDYDAPDKVTFSYKLEGFDEEWIHAGTRDYVSYSNLKPGDYKLKVSAKTARGVKSDIASLDFTIAKPWFKSNLAYFIYGLLFIFLIFVMLKIREWYLLNKKNSELANINKKLKEANQELKNISTKDHLTGLFNKRYFETKLDDLLNLAKRSNTHLTLIMLDIDNFKPINDRFGHLAGDYYLADIGETMGQQLQRSTDFAARYGGDEFAVVLYDTDKEEALKIAERIKKSVANVSIRPEFGPLGEKSTTASIGIISIIPDQSSTLKEIIAWADKALYQAKQLGRNNIIIDEGNSN